MELFWIITFIILIIFITGLIPFAFTLYEADEDDPLCERVSRACMYTVIFNIVMVLLFLIFYFALGWN